MHGVPILTVSAVVVALTQLVRWAGLDERWAPAAVAVLAALGVGLWAAAAGPPAPSAAFDYFAAWVTVTTSAAGVFGFTRASSPGGRVRRC
jgi:hypothetical protein